MTPPDDYQDVLGFSWNGYVDHSEWTDSTGRDIPKLEGFEQVLGRKLTCHSDCNLGYYCREVHFHGDIHNCDYAQLKEDTVNEIKLKDREIEATKIDTHPRFFISNEVHYCINPEPVSLLTIDFNPKKNLQIRQALIKLELFL